MAMQPKPERRGPFDDERFVPDKRYSHHRTADWDLLTAAADKLHVKKEKDKTQTSILNKQRLVYTLERKGMFYADGDAAVANLLKQLAPSEVRSAVVGCFELLIEKARSDFEFHDLLRQPGLIQHDSSVESVIETLSFKWARWLSHSDIQGLIEDYISVLQKGRNIDLCYLYKLFLVSALKKEHYTDLYYQYRSALAERRSLEGDTRLSCILKGLKNCDIFKENGFDSISLSDLEAGLLDYISFLVDNERKGRGNDIEACYRERILEIHAHDKAEWDKSRQRFPAEFTDPIHFLVFKEREEGYAIQHPVVEIAKFRAYFNHDFLRQCQEGDSHPGNGVSRWERLSLVS